MSFEDEGRYAHVNPSYRYDGPYKRPQRPAEEFCNGLQDGDTEDRHGWYVPWYDEPGPEEVSQRVLEAAASMPYAKRIFMLRDPRVFDIVLAVDSDGTMRHDNRWVQPKFGRAVHVFDLNEIRGCGPMDLECVYDKGDKATALGPLKDLDMSNSKYMLDSYRSLMNAFGTMDIADILDREGVRNVYADMRYMNPHDRIMYVDFADERKGIAHMLSIASGLNITVLLCGEQPEDSGLLRIYHNRRFDGEKDAIAADIPEAVRCGSTPMTRRSTRSTSLSRARKGRRS